MTGPELDGVCELEENGSFAIADHAKFDRLTPLQYPLAAALSSRIGDLMSGMCLMQGVTPSPLSLGWERKDGEKVLEWLHGGPFAKYSPIPLPAEMGTGSVLIHSRPPSTIDPNDMIAIFRCGGVIPSKI
ncbi:hypothetical protein C1I98_21985 [Spongiactinospora gelatinilytica]|uniref:Uncharacterized protein n=1 Tax=Spongiactinospora gelatinilytica TaxID=2666298 RepID=A0A2W2FZ87_9ACTN|nr:hypothetical protein [Spongiactinospora gelatinilytica]PZG41013.1 hypothetical protein C1I98_21985 [Spongiactinospora gelatinilytica]